jgi:hypothetical protein
MKKQTAIWLDFKEAFLIELEGSKEANVVHLDSGIDFSAVKGGSRSNEPWGPMEKTSESKFLGRRRNEEAAYFNAIMEAVADADEVYIFGPAEAKDGLVKAIKQGRFSPKLLSVETADSMTLNQKVARARKFFEGGIKLT